MYSPSRSLTVRLSHTLFRAVIFAARAQGVSVNEMVRSALIEQLERMETENEQELARRNGSRRAADSQ